ncbi:MAG: site-specific integrase [Oscillospiraceae bacterium]|nr:site-specific integrase [Oscillospiraceae bacterium]
MARKAAAGTGTIRKKTQIKHGKEYTWWEARYTTGYDPGTGKQIQKTITGKTQKEVSQKLKAATAAIDEGTYVAPCKMTVGQWMDTWREEYLGSVKPLTLQTYSLQIDKHIKPGLGATKLDTLTPHLVQKFYNSLQMSPKSVKNVHGVLHSALQQAVLNGLISVNPTNACKLPKVEKYEIQPLEPHQVAALLQEARKDSYANLFTVAVFTGMRQGELLGLSWDNVNFETGIITVKQQLQCKDGNYFLQTPKNGKGRTILPAQVVMDTLKAEQAKQQKAQESSMGAWSNPHNFVFTDALGKHLVRRTVVKHFKAITERAGITARFHDLRHSFAVNSLMIGDDVKTVQANLGHATAAFTLDVYGHITQKMQEDSANRMQQFFESVRVQ